MYKVIIIYTDNSKKEIKTLCYDKACQIADDLYNIKTIKRISVEEIKEDGND